MAIGITDRTSGIGALKYMAVSPATAAHADTGGMPIQTWSAAGPTNMEPVLDGNCRVARHYLTSVDASLTVSTLAIGDAVEFKEGHRFTNVTLILEASKLPDGSSAGKSISYIIPQAIVESITSSGDNSSYRPIEFTITFKADRASAFGSGTDPVPAWAEVV